MAKSKHFNSAIANPTGHKMAQKTFEPTTTIIVPTAASSPTLTSVINTHDRQTESHRTILIETSGDPQAYFNLTINQSERKNTRILAIEPEENCHPCRVITEAIDIGIAICDTEWAFLTHDDVWLNDTNLLKRLIEIAENAGVPIVGYEMSPRGHCTEEWRGMVSHTATLLHTPTMQGLGMRWSLVEAHQTTPWSKEKPGWPDTETNFGRQVKRLQIPQFFIGHETNDRHFEDDNITHRRSLTSHRVHSHLGKIDDEKWIAQQIVLH